MDKRVVLQLMRERADDMAKHPSYECLVNQLADLLADSRGRLSKDNFDNLIMLGAALYKAGSSQFNARQDVDDLMKNSVSERQGSAPSDSSNSSNPSNS